MTTIIASFNYWIVIVLMMMGLYIMIARDNLVKKLIGLSIFQTAIFYFYISLGKVSGGSAPILDPDVITYSNPLPHVLILTAIVVGVATTAVGLALIIRIYDHTGSIEEDDIRQLEYNLIQQKEEQIIASTSENIINTTDNTIPDNTTSDERSSNEKENREEK